MSTKNLCDLGPFLLYGRTEFLADEFNEYTSTALWTTFTTNSGTVAHDSTSGSSKILLTTGTTAGNPVGARSTNQIFLPASGRPGFAATRLTYTNQATTTGCPFFGVSSTTSLTMTSSLDPLASFMGALIYKRAGDTTFSVVASNGATRASGSPTLTNIPGTDGTYDLRIDWQDKNSLEAEVVYTINGQLATDSNNRVIKHTVAYSGLTKMYVVLGVQTSTNNAQTAFYDYGVCGQLRSGL